MTIWRRILLVRPALTVAGFYAVITVALLATHAWDPAFFATVGPQWQRHDPGMRKRADGSIFFDFASDPAGARHRHPVFRSWRILYPATAHVLALGRASLVGWSLLLINLVAIVLGTEVVDRMATSSGLHRSAALAYGAWGGLGLALLHGTCEPLAYLLVLLGIDLRRREHVTVAGLAFLAALLTRETTLLVAAPWLLRGEIATGSPRLDAGRRAMTRGRIVAGGVFAAWAGSLWLLAAPDASRALPGDGRVALPLSGFLGSRPVELSLAATYLVIPCIVVIGWALGERRRRRWDASIWAVVLNAGLVLTLPPASASSLWHSGRLATGFVLSALLAPPLATSAPRLSRALTILFVSSASWTVAVAVRYLLWDVAPW